MPITSNSPYLAISTDDQSLVPLPPPPDPILIPGLTDPVATRQWHLGLIGDVGSVWADYTGRGVKVGIYDSGIERAHWDLAGNYDASLHVTVRGRTYDGDVRVRSGPHGTAVAGIVAASRNGEGTVGIAYDAGITGVNIFDPFSGGGRDPGIFVNAADRSRYLEALAEGRAFDVTNHSYGTPSSYSGRNDRGDETSFVHWQARAFEHTATFGRDGLGTVTVAAAGNDGLDMAGTVYTARHVIAVGAYRHDGLMTSYTSHGSGLLLSAPSDDDPVFGGVGVVTTDLLGDAGYNTFDDPGGQQDETDLFGGTSAAAPMVTAAVALMMQANPDLGWRDVSTILAASATMPVPFDTGPTYIQPLPDPQAPPERPPADPLLLNRNPFRVSGQDANWNGGGYHRTNDYGYGALNVHDAVRMAEVWSLFGPAKTSANERHVETRLFEVGLTSQPSRQEGQPGNNVFRDFEGLPQSFSFRVDQDIAVEHVDMVLTYAVRADGFEQVFSMEGERIKLIAPDGTAAFIDAYGTMGQLAVGSHSFTFGLRNFYGVESAGEWTLQFEASGLPMTVLDLKLHLYGADVTVDDVHSYTDEFLTMATIAGEGDRRTLTDADGGTDWINAAAMTADVDLSLVEGATSRFDGRDAFTIARGSLIEHAVTGDGNDRLFGNALDNRLYGMRGNDWLNGGAGNDTLFGGQGNDVFAFDTAGVSGRDKVLDWSAGDRIATSKMLRGADQNGMLTIGSSALLLLDGNARGDTAELVGQGGATLTVLGKQDGYWWYGFLSEGNEDFVDGRVTELALGQPGWGTADLATVAAHFAAPASTVGIQDAAFFLYDVMGDAMLSGVQTYA